MDGGEGYHMPTISDNSSLLNTSFSSNSVDSISCSAEVLRTTRDEPPTHFTLGIKSFSLLSKSSLEIYESGAFEAGGYKWKLRLYPKGNKSQQGEGYLSVYLVMSDTNTLSVGSEVRAFFRLLVLDQLRDNYLTLQVADGRARRFRASINPSAGFTRFITLKEFNDPLKGFLVDDNCVFGADVFIQENFPSRGEWLLMKSVPVDCKHTWKINKFSDLNQERHYSDIFTAGGFNWRILVYPKRESKCKGKSLSLFLELNDSTKDQGVYAEYELKIVDQIHTKHKELKGEHWFKDSTKDWGWRDFLALSSFRDQSNGYLVNDVCIIEAHVELIGTIEKSE